MRNASIAVLRTSQILNHFRPKGTTAKMSSDSPRVLKILMLHGYTQSGALFHAKTRALEKLLGKNFPAGKSPISASYPGGVKLIYPTGPLRLLPADIPGYSGDYDSTDNDNWAWWKRDMSNGEYVSLNLGLQTIREAIDAEGGVDAVMGFSQGAAAASMVTSLLEPGRKEAFSEHEKKGGVAYPKEFLTSEGEVFHPPLKFAVIYSGFYAPHELYRAFYEPKMNTDMVHFIGTMDTLVEEGRSVALADANEKSVIARHPGGHFVPVNKEMAGVLIGFVKQTCGEKEVEESVEDMDVPF